ncbi:MAG: tape measure protein, partial [Actinomycetota bacterium]
MGAVVTDVLETRLELTNLGGYKAALGAAGSAVDFFGGRLDASTRRTVAAGAAAAGAAVGYGLLARAVGEAGRRQQLEIGLRTVLGSAEAAKAKLEELQRFAAGSPFDFAESARGAQQLLAMGVAADDLIPIMTAAGNASAAAGGDVQTFLRSLRAIGQIKTKGTLGLEELLQLTEAGIPAIEILREELGLSADQMKNISAQGIEAGKAIDALTRGMNKRFGGAMSEQMKSLEGSFSNLRDASNEALAALGAPVAPWVTGVANTVRGAVDAFNQLPEVIKSGAAVALVAGTVGFAHYAGKVALSSLKAQELAGENADLLNSTLKTSKAADSLGDEEDETGRQMGAAGDYASGLTGKLWPLAAAHDAAAAAAHRHADAEQRMGRASPRVESSGTVAGGTQRGPTGKRSPRAASGDAQPSGATQPAGGKATAPKKGRFKLPKL